LNHQGFTLIDPHGDVAERTVASIPSGRRSDLVYFNLPDRSPPFGFNPLIGVAPTTRPLAAAGLLDAFRTVWRDFWGPRLEHVLRNALLALLDQPAPTLADLPRLLADARYRKNAMLRVGNPIVRQFWLEEYEGYPTRLRAEAIAPLQNKLGAFLSDRTLHTLLTHPRGALDLRRLMDNRGILIVNLAKGRIGHDAASLFGSLMVSQLSVAAMGRANVLEQDRPDFWVHLDEFQTLAGAGLAPMLAELRKYRVGLTLANQHLDQLDPVVREAILGNAGTLVCFRLGPSDAELIEQEFKPEFRSTDLVNLPNRHIYIRLMAAGTISRPFSAETLPIDYHCGLPDAPALGNRHYNRQVPFPRA
jgi:hypothetical protein